MWPIEKCSELFRALVKQAFTLRSGQNIKGFRLVQIFVKKSRYETKPLQNALQHTFGSEEVLFDRIGKEHSRRLKVAVTTTSASGSKAYLLSNYNTKNTPSMQNRESNTTPSYQRLRTTRRGNEMLVWEA